MADDIDPPRWLLLSALVAGGGVLTFGLAGLLLAVNDSYSPALAFPIGLAGLIALVALTGPVLSAPPVTARAARVVALVGVGAILALTVWNGANASQHVLVDRDGGVYAEAGRWIARSGSLEVPAAVGPFRNMPTPVFGFAHLLPALLAEAHALGGGDGLYHLPPLLGGIALLEFFVLAWRVLRRPGFALAATLALGLIVPQVAFTRDTYSEIPSQILLFSAIGLLVHRRDAPHWRAALAAGLFLGATQATRIDATVFFVGIPALFAIGWLCAAAGPQRRAMRASTVAFALGVLPGVALGVIDLVHHSGSYWDSLWHDERRLVALVAASTVGCALVVRLWRYLLPLVRALPWNSISWAATGLVLVAGLGAWFLRPHLQINQQGALIRFHEGGRLVVRATRLDYERSMIWMSWYLGPLTLLTAIAGVALLPRALVRGRMTHVVVPLVVLAPGSLLYLWDASAYPDHVWVTRRFLVGAFPMLILLALGVAARLWATAPSRRRIRAGRGAAIAIAVVAVAFPAYTLLPVRSMREQVGYLSVVRDACDAMGEHPAVLAVQQLPLIPTDVYEEWALPALRGWCGADVDLAPFRSTTGDALRRRAREWKALGRRFFVIGLSAPPILALVPEARVTPTRRVRNSRLLEQTITDRPSGYVTESFSLVVAEIPAR